MIALAHINSEFGTNTSSCRAYAEYLLKYNEYFFSHSTDSLNLEEAVDYIDSNSKKRLLHTEAKWYAPIYALSEDESKFIAKKICDREVENYHDLLEHEKIAYDNYVIMLAKNFQNEMAKNFQKSDMGIESGKDLFYIGVVENKRKYSIEEKKCIWNLEEVGESKSGFNTHIHIIQSRLANNGKYSKISPMAKSKTAVDSPLAGRKGFNRVVFSETIEKTFDNITGYNRNIEQTFAYKNDKKKEYLRNKKQNSNHEKYFNKVKTDYILSSNKIKIKERNFSAKEIKRLQKEISCREYFHFLFSIGLLEKVKSEGVIDYYKNLNEEEIVVMDSSWRNITTKDVGYVYNAPMYFEKTNWLGAMNRLAELDSKKDKAFVEGYEVKEKKSQKLIEVLYETKERHFKNYLEEELSKNIIDMYLVPIKYESSNGKKYESFAIENENGGFYIYNSKYENYTKVGEAGLTYIRGAKESDKVVIFENYMDYLRFLELNDANKMSENVIILNGYENKNRLIQILREQHEDKEILFMTSSSTYFDIKNAGIECRDIRADIGISKNLPSIKDLLKIKKIKAEVHTVLENQKKKRAKALK